MNFQGSPKTDGAVQGSLPLAPARHVGPSPGHTIRQDFEAFDARYPEVYRELVTLARQAKARGQRKIGMKLLFEVVRWNRLMNTTDFAGFRLNNNYTALYARKVIDREPDLADMFQTRRLHVVEDAA